MYTAVRLEDQEAGGRETIGRWAVRLDRGRRLSRGR